MSKLFRLSCLFAAAPANVEAGGQVDQDTPAFDSFDANNLPENWTPDQIESDRKNVRDLLGSIAQLGNEARTNITAAAPLAHAVGQLSSVAGRSGKDLRHLQHVTLTVPGRKATAKREGTPDATFTMPITDWYARMSGSRAATAREIFSTRATWTVK